MDKHEKLKNIINNLPSDVAIHREIKKSVNVLSFNYRDYAYSLVNSDSMFHTAIIYIPSNSLILSENSTNACYLLLNKKYEQQKEAMLENWIKNG